MIISLLKNRIYGFLSTINGGFKRKYDMSFIMKLAPLVLIYIFAQSTAGLTFLIHKTVKSFIDFGCELEGFFLFGSIVFSVFFVFNIFTIRSQLFDAKDNEMLLSLPIKHSSIVISRLISIYFLNLFIIFILGVSFLWSYLLHGGSISLISGIIFFIELMAMALFVLGLSCFMDWLFSVITTKFSKRESIITFLTTVSLLISLVIAGFSVYYFVTFREDLDISFMKKGLFVFYYFADSIINKNLFSFILFLLISFSTFIIAELLISKNFLKLFSLYQKKTEKTKNIKNYHTNSCLTSMIKKELILIFKEKMYLVNAGLGCIFLIIISCVVIFNKDLIYKLSDKKEIVSAILIALPFVCNVVNIFSASSVSLEGNSLWLPRSLPIPSNMFFLSKAFAHTVMCVPPIIIFATVANIFYDMSILYRIYIYIIPIALSFLTAFSGILTNVKFPAFDFVNVASAVKQGISSIAALFINSMISSIVIFMYIVLHKFINDGIYLSIILLIILIADVKLFIEINKKSDLWISQLDKGQK